MYVCVCVCVCVCVFVFVFVCMYVCMYMYLYIYTGAWPSAATMRLPLSSSSYVVCIYIHIHAHAHTYATPYVVCIYIHTHRRVAFGRNYAPAVEFKFQLYVSVTLCIFLLSALANTLGSLAMAAQEQQPLDFIAVGCARAVGFGVPIIVQVFIHTPAVSV